VGSVIFVLLKKTGESDCFLSQGDEKL